MTCDAILPQTQHTILSRDLDPNDVIFFQLTISLQLVCKKNEILVQGQTIMFIEVQVTHFLVYLMHFDAEISC